MKELLDNRSVVIVGSWNLKIFTPQWIESQLRKTPGSTEFTFMMGGPTHHLQEKFEKSILILASDRIVLRPVDLEDGSLIEVEQTAVAILKKLEHTPLIAVGINFQFQEESPNKDEMKLFETTDNNRISDSLFRINSTVIKRTIEKEGSVLNLSLKLENSKINYEFNHHFETTSCSQAIEKIESKTVGLKNKSLKFMETIYGKLST